MLTKKEITFLIIEICTDGAMRTIVKYVHQFGYQCFMLHNEMLIPLDATDGGRWWYPKLNNPRRTYWGNFLCTIKENAAMKLFWHLFHAHDNELTNAYHLVTAYEGK